MIYKLYPECKDYLWGGNRLKTEYGKVTDKTPCAESWELSFHKDGQTKIADGRTLAEVVTDEDKGENCKKFRFFPTLIKFIDAERNLSVQVHPSDEYALKNENSFGKTECWYIADAAEGAGIYCGFARDTSETEFLRYLADGKVEELLNFIPVKKGECYFIAAGTLHAIGAGCLVYEVQQNSNLTYRVYDYGRRGADGKLRELHIDKAVKVINYKKYVPVTFTDANSGVAQTIAECEYFRLRKLTVKGGYSAVNGGSFTCVTAVDGSGTINGERFSKGDSFFVTAKQKFTVAGAATVLLTDVPD